MLKAESYGYEYKTVRIRRDHVHCTEFDRVLNDLDTEGYFVFHIEKYTDGGSVYIFGRRERPNA